MSIKKSVIAAAVFASLSGVSMMANAAPSADVTLGVLSPTLPVMFPLTMAWRP
ncbi:hypothetical protein [Klebsiella pneumoniae]|uniref:hypothetical protein n=1 Tax=Klebsiella pneumoniae TaxID=573 RepID=UPI00216583A5|nr:hypothetical protein [Klebsiella pneumoniae]MDQ2569191.1 hypothetical protein [Klebsiella pneumoniae]